MIQFAYLTLRIAAHLIALHGPGDQTIYVNPKEVVSARAPRSEEHFSPGVQCVLNMSDGKFNTVIEDCNIVDKLIEESYEDGGHHE
jgi:hypothetical protein